MRFAPLHPNFNTIANIQFSSTFLPKDSPRYHAGYSICISFIALSALSCIVYLISILIQNQNRNRASESNLTEFEKTELGDLNPEYRYLL